MDKATDKSNEQTRRSFVKAAAWVAPAILTLKAAPAFAQNGSTRHGGGGGQQSGGGGGNQQGGGGGGNQQGGGGGGNQQGGGGGGQHGGGGGRQQARQQARQNLLRWLRSLFR